MLSPIQNQLSRTFDFTTPTLPAIQKNCIKDGGKVQIAASGTIGDLMRAMEGTFVELVGRPFTLFRCSSMKEGLKLTEIDMALTPRHIKETIRRSSLYVRPHTSVFGKQYFYT